MGASGGGSEEPRPRRGRIRHSSRPLGVRASARLVVLAASVAPNRAEIRFEPLVAGVACAHAPSGFDEPRAGRGRIPLLRVPARRSRFAGSRVPRAFGAQAAHRLAVPVPPRLPLVRDGSPHVL
jgi:hypothetical protein